MKGLTVRLAIVAAALAGLLAFGAAPSLANHVQCGDFITQDTRLDSDLNCNSGVLSVGSNVVLDLKGHTVRVNGSPGAGIHLTDGATVKNGSIEGTATFDSFGRKRLSCRGGAVGSGNWITVTHLRIKNCSRPINLEGSHNRVLDNQVFDFTESVEREESVGISVESAAEQTVPPLTGNSVVGNYVFNSSPAPIEEPGRFFNEVAINVFRGRGDVVERNVSDGNRWGILVGSQGASVERNLAIRSDGEAIRLNVDGGRVVRNVANEDRPSPLAGDVGITLDGAESPTLFERNIAEGFEFDGIRVLQPGTTVAKNRANDNGEWGIIAVPGIIDGGGNKASGNGNPGQCLNVSCK